MRGVWSVGRSVNKKELVGGWGGGGEGLVEW